MVRVHVGDKVKIVPKSFTLENSEPKTSTARKNPDRALVGTVIYTYPRFFTVEFVVGNGVIRESFSYVEPCEIIK